MARYPTFEEYQKTGKFEDGIKRCDDLLQKNPNDVQLLTVKLQLLYATKEDAKPIVEQLLSIQPPILDLRELAAIEEAIVESQHNDYPQPETCGPEMTKLWENAFKTSGSTNYKLDLQSLRFSRAIINNRLGDAQQALIQLKVLQPRNRAIYMAHAAITQLLSTSKEDLQSRLALSLARKAVTEKFDEDRTLDCRVSGQIFALQGSTKDLESIGERSFRDSKQVDDALRKSSNPAVNGSPPVPETKDPAAVSPAEWLASEIQTLKTQFSALIESSSNVETVLSFVANAVRLFHTAITSISDIRGRGSADACFLSISALVRAFEQTEKALYLLQGAYLAETLLKKNPHIHEARLILVYLYMRLGLGSLALRLFDSLSVKEIQHDTVGHALFTGLSLIHPQSTSLGKKQSFEPLKRAQRALTVYTRHEEKLAENEASVLTHNQTGLIFDVQELRNRLRMSVTRRIIHLEGRRLERLLHGTWGDDTAQLGPQVIMNWIETADNRDFAGTFDYGYKVEKVLHGSNGTLPGKYWILYTLAADSAWCLAMDFSTPVQDPSTIIEELTTATLDINRLQIDDSTASSLGLSNAEYLAGDLACQVLKVLLALSERSPDLAKPVDAVLHSIDALHVNALVETSDVFTERLKDHYAYLDVLRIVIRACTFVRNRTEECASELQKMQDLAKWHYDALQSHAQDQSKRIEAADIRTLMEKEGSTWDACKEFGEGGIKSFCASVAESAREGWQGLKEIKLM